MQNVFKKELSPEEERDEIRDALGADGLVDPRTGGWWPSDELAVSMLPEVFYGDFWDQLVSKPTRVKRVVFLRNGEHLVFQGMRGRMARCAYTADPDLMPKLPGVGAAAGRGPGWSVWAYRCACGTSGPAASTRSSACAHRAGSLLPPHRLPVSRVAAPTCAPLPRPSPR